MARQIVVEITGNSQGFSKATEEAQASAHKFGGVMNGIGAGIGIGIFNMASSAVSGLVEQVKASEEVFKENQTSIALLGTALKDNVPGWNGNTTAIEATTASFARIGFNANEVRDSFAKLAGVTHNVDQAMNDSRLAADLARAKHLDLATATTVVTKVMEGNTKGLKSLGIEFLATTSHVDALKASTGQHTAAQLKAAEAADKQANALGGMQAIYKNVKGAAETYAGTSEGRVAAANAKMTQEWVKVGAIVDRISQAVLPYLVTALSTVVDKINPTITWIQKMYKESDVFRAVLIGLIAIVAALTVVVLVFAVTAAVAWVAAFWPVILIVLAVGAVVAVLALVWTRNLGDIQGKTAAVVSWLKNAFQSVKEFVGEIGPAFSAMGSVVSGVWDGISGAIRQAINSIIGDINGFIRGVDSIHVDIPGKGSVGFNIPTIPSFALGGVMPYTGLAYLHAGETVSRPGQARGMEIHIHIDQGAYIDGPGIDILTNRIAQRLSFASGR